MSNTALLPQKLEYLKILRVKRDKETNKLEVHCNINYHNDEFIKEDSPEDVFAEMVIKPDFAIHEDLEVLFKELGIHLAFVSDQLDTDDFANEFFNHVLSGGEKVRPETEKIVKKVMCTYVIFDKDEHKDSIHLGGQRMLKSGNILNMHCSNVRYTRTENYNYAFFERLGQCIENMQKEVTAYLYGKCQPHPVQLEIFEMPKKKRGRKSKADAEFAEAE